MNIFLFLFKIGLLVSRILFHRASRRISGIYIDLHELTTSFLNIWKVLNWRNYMRRRVRFSLSSINRINHRYFRYALNLLSCHVKVGILFFTLPHAFVKLSRWYPFFWFFWFRSVFVGIAFSLNSTLVFSCILNLRSSFFLTNILLNIWIKFLKFIIRQPDKNHFFMINNR